MTRPFDVIGTTVPKRDGAEKVTGRTRYLHDLVLPRLAHGKILRSRHPHARLVRVDTRRARALPGVLAVLTGDDVEPRPFGVAKDQTALKRGKVRSVRDEVAALADWDPVGNLTMWTTTQVPFLYRRDLGEALGIGGDRVRVLQPPVGGNFGRGLDLYPIDVIAALLALHCRRPVKIEFDRVEEFIACPGREPCTIRLRTAADRDGRLLARDAHVTIDNGAYTSWGSTTPYVMLATVAGLYRVPSVRFDTTIVYTNNPYSGSMRGYGNPESTFAVESQMDDLAERLGLDRLDVRRRNASKPGDVNPQGFVLTSFAMTECIDAAAEERRRDPPPLRPGRKRGGIRRGEGEGAAPRVRRRGARGAGGAARRRGRRRVRAERAAPAASVRAGGAGGTLQARRARARRRGLLRPADGDARQRLPGERLRRVRLGVSGGARRRRAGDGQDRGTQDRLRARRRPRAQPRRRGRSGARRHPHGARLRAHREAGRRGGPDPDAELHGLRGFQGRRHARDRRAPHRDGGRGGPVRRQGARRVGRHPRRRRGRERPEGRARRPLHRAADHARPRARGARRPCRLEGRPVMGAGQTTRARRLRRAHDRSHVRAVASSASAVASTSASGSRSVRWWARSLAARSAICSLSGSMRMPTSVTSRLTTATASGPRRQGSTRTSAYALDGRTSSSRRDCPTAATAAAWGGSRAARNAMTMLAARTTIATPGALSVGIPLDTLPSDGRRSRPASPRPG